MIVLETERLRIRHLEMTDDAFILELLNEPGWLKNIGDRGVHTLEDAQRYIENGPRTSYAKNGFGLYAVELKDSGVVIGMCGLIKRDTLEDVDIGYALLERYWSKGYAYEAASAVLDYGFKTIGLKRIVAIIEPSNEASARVLEKIGLRFDRIVTLGEDKQVSKLFVSS